MDAKSELNDLRLRIKDHRRHVDNRMGEAKALARRGTSLESKINELKIQIVVHDKAIQLLTSIGEERQETAQRQIETLVTRGLQTIFGNTYSFHLVQSVKNKRPEVELIIRSTLSRGRIIDTPIMGARGGGVTEVVGVLLRIVILLLDKKDKDIPLILDEPLSHLSVDHLAPMAEFLRELVNYTGIQIIMVTHQREFGVYADKVYEFTLADGVTKAKELFPSDI